MAINKRYSRSARTHQTRVQVPAVSRPVSLINNTTPVSHVVNVQLSRFPRHALRPARAWTSTTLRAGTDACQSTAVERWSDLCRHCVVVTSIGRRNDVTSGPRAETMYRICQTTRFAPRRRHIGSDQVALRPDST